MSVIFTCPKCGRRSNHPTDVAQGYCGACHAWTGQMPRDYVAINRTLAIAAAGPRR